MSSWSKDVVSRTRRALEGVADPSKSAAMQSYMKHVAPFLGVQAVPRRRVLRVEWRDLRTPSSAELGRASLDLMAQETRECHYAAADLVNRYIDVANENFCPRYVTRLLNTKPWWDTVDSFVSVAVSPLTRRYDHDDLIDQWSESENLWLIRAALGHQRGWKEHTDVGRVIGLCDRHWANPEFFVAKAIGWALRDLTAIDAGAVRRFLSLRTQRNAVAEREARRGLERVGGIALRGRGASTR
ncbi:MAG TPA: DNA alkylation repair protein [Acidimicrobiales bacterium]|nr:DNA alkylation repair protein [Acidimicrobiales bacterium]HUX03834.1 DNA alkylation repair protein [Acidimicrobiales bacterium]